MKPLVLKTLWARGAAALLMMGLSWAVMAAPPWIWIDEAGRRVFSDLPPPASVPDHRIVRQPVAPPQAPAIASPGPSGTAQEAPAVEGANSAPNSPVTPGTTVTVENEQQRRAVEQRNAEIRADNCRRAQESLAMLQRPGPLATVNERGQQVIMTDSVRRAETARAQTIIRENCAP